MKHLVPLLVALLPMVSCQAADHLLKPGDPPQAVLDRAAAGDRVVFLPGLHQHRLGKHRSLLYVDKPVEIELQAGATLKLADGETTQEKTPEITTDHGAPKRLDDLAVGGEYDLSLADKAHSNEVSPGVTIYTIMIEPNFQLDGFEVVGNVIKSGGQAIHCWRMSSNGLVADNLRIHDNTGLPVVVANAPGGWKPPVNLTQRNNRNHLSDRAKEPPSPFEPNKASRKETP